MSELNEQVLKKVAVVGCSFRFPGTTTDRYWPDLVQGKDLVSEVDPNRWAMETFRHPSKKHGGTSYTFASGTLGDVSGFDASFFGISPREAAQMDPQQRLLLELAWEAFENANIPASAVKGKKCGVFIGISSADYGMRFADDLGAVDASVGTGTASCIAANRISYFFDFKGPSMAIDTACSSSMIAFHQACQSILTGETSMAIAGGVSLLLHPYGFITFSKASMLSRKGSCSVFDASADGYVRSEGGGIFILKDYDQAVADGDPILAVVAGSNVNSDGKKTGLTVPSSEAQARLLTEAYERAGIPATDISYIEAHGTGTPVGDPIEANALAKALGHARPPGHPLLIGSVKSNLGHMEAASGVAGLVKALYCIKHRVVPATIHFKTPNPNIPFEDWNLKVVAETTDLPARGRIVVGVNSFGFGGANAHVILESPTPRTVAAKPQIAPNGRHSLTPLFLSAKSEAALKDVAQQYVRLLQEEDTVDLYDVAYNAALNREWHTHRLVVFGASPQAVAESLKGFGDSKPNSPSFGRGTALAGPQKVAFIYSGNGSQWEGMGRNLLAESSIFKSAVQNVQRHFEKFGEFSIEDELRGLNGLGRYARTEIAQPALFAMQVGITEMLRDYGVAPAVVAGHSVGEVAAAWACGALSLEQAVEVIYYRSHFQGLTKGQGQMTAVVLDASSMQALLDETHFAEHIVIAGINSARGVTLAGSAQALTEFEALLLARRVTFKRLDLDYAFHSAAMDPVQGELVAALRSLAPGATSIDFVSTVTGTALHGTKLDADYWWQNIRQPVQFEQATQTILASDVAVFVEVGPHAVLRGYINECLKASPRSGRVIAPLMRAEESPEHVLNAAFQVILAGAKTDLSRFFPCPGRFVALPNYPWQRDRHWQSTTPDSFQLLQRHKVNPLLGYALGQSEFVWENQIDPVKYPELADHVVSGSIVFPGTGYAELALAAAEQWAAKREPADWIGIEELDIKMLMVLQTESTKLVRVCLDPSDGSIQIRSRDQFSTDPWTLHANGRAITEASGDLLGQDNAQWPNRQPDFDAQAHDHLTRLVGLDYGRAFQTIKEGWVQGQTVWAKLQLSTTPSDTLTQSLLHPGLLDCSFQLILHLLTDRSPLPSVMAYLPTKIGRISLLAHAALPAIAKAELKHVSPHSLSANFTLFDAAGNRIASIRQVRFRRVPLGQKAAAPLSLLSYAVVPQAHPQKQVVAPAALADVLHKELRTAAELLGRDDRSQIYAREVEPLLAALTTSYAVEAFLRLSNSKRTLSDQELSQLIGSTPDAPIMLDRMLTILEDDHWVERLTSGWQLHDATELIQSSAIWNTLLAEHTEHFPAIYAVGRVGIHWVDLIQGQTTLAQVLSTNITFAKMAKYNAFSASYDAIAQALVAAAQTCLTQLTEGQRFCVVEIGNSAPVLLGSLMQQLPIDRCQMIFSSKCPDALDEARRLQDHLPSLGVNHLGDDLSPAGVLPRAHLLIVHNDFQTQHDAQETLDSVVQLLAPGGSILWASTQPARWLNLLFGAQNTLNTSSQHWRQQLEARALKVDSPVALPPRIPDSPYVLLGQAPQRAAAAPEMAGFGTWLFLVDASNSNNGWLGALVDALPSERIEFSPPELDLENPTALGEYLLTLKTQHGALQGVVHLQGLNNDQGLPDADVMLKHQLRRCAVVTALVKACEAIQVNTTGWLVTAGVMTRGLPNRIESPIQTVDAPLFGLGRTLLNEPGHLNVRLLDLERQPDGALLNAMVARALARELVSPTDEREVILTASGDRFVPRLRPAFAPRLLPAEPPSSQRVHLSFQTPGQLRHLRWESAPTPVLRANDVAIEVKATGLNFRDVIYALGMLSDEAVESGFAGPTLGLECAGVISECGSAVQGFTVGDRVIAFGAACFSNRVITPASAVAKLPANICFEAAATIPTAFFTVYYALCHLARLQPGERVLIHGAAGGVGLAAIQLAKHLGAEIFATAGSTEKRDLLQLLGVRHIFDSRSLSFADQIMVATQGQGVDVVLNSLAGEAVNRNLGILKPFGRFLELGKRDFYENTKVGLRPFRNNISYFGIDADQLMQAQPALAESLFKDVLALFAQGVLHPLPHCTIDANDVVDAFRDMQQSRHMGKIVVTYRAAIHSVHDSGQQPPVLTLPADASYLVTGGLGGFGLRTAQWLVEKGARHLVLISRSGPVSDEALNAISVLEAQGIRVLAQACDVTRIDQLNALFQRVAASMPPLRGVVHAAAVIDDALIRNTTREQLATVLTPKIVGARHLHELTRQMSLDFFVLYSSATTLFGNPGQGAYVAANAYLEALAHSRRAAGLPAVCVRWGAIDDVGFLARNTKIKDALQGRMGGQTIPSQQALAVLEELLMSNRSDLGVLDMQWSALSRFLPSASEPKFADLAATHADAQAEEAHSSDIDQMIRELSPNELSVAIQEMLKVEVAEILRLAPEKIDVDGSVYDLGLDSLMGVELVLAIESRFHIQLSVMTLSESPTIRKLAEKLVHQLQSKAAGEDSSAPSEGIDAQVLHVAAQHGAEVDPHAVRQFVQTIESGVDTEQQPL